MTPSQELIEKTMDDFKEEFWWGKETCPALTLEQRKAIREWLRPRLLSIQEARDKEWEAKIEGSINHIKGFHQLGKHAYHMCSWDAGLHDALFDVEKHLITLLPN